MMLNFCLQSLFREYGWQFFRRVFLPHPIRTARAILDAARRDVSGEPIAVGAGMPGANLGGRRSIVGVGFCLKPMNPPCLSGRANHDCLYLERLMPSQVLSIPECCRPCAIRQLGIMALNAGAAFYIMTSARDILFDLLLPALDEGRFDAGLFVLCRYSLRPFTVGLQASRIRGWLLPFERGDCRDYPTWLLADRGLKNEQTAITENNRKKISELLGNPSEAPGAERKFIRRGNLFCPSLRAGKRSQP